MSRIQIMLFCAAIVGALGLEARAFGQDLVESNVVKVAPPNPSGIRMVKIKNPLGGVSVVGHDSPNVIVRARKRATSQAALDRLSVSLTPTENGTLEMRTEILSDAEQVFLKAGSVGIELEVSIPRRAVPLIEVERGHVAVEGLDNGARVLANDATVDFLHVSGRIQSHTTGGRQQFVELVQASLESLAVEGDLAFKQVGGPMLTAYSHSGAIFASGLKIKKLNIRSFRGPITVVGVLARSGSYDIASRYGDVSFTFVDPEQKAVVFAESDIGYISMPETYKRQELTVIPGTPRVALRSRLGDISVATIQSLPTM